MVCEGLGLGLSGSGWVWGEWGSGVGERRHGLKHAGREAYGIAEADDPHIAPTLRKNACLFFETVFGPERSESEDMGGEPQCIIKNYIKLKYLLHITY